MTGPDPGEAAVELAVRLVRTDSVNPALVPGAAGEGAAVALLADRLAARGFETRIVPGGANGDRPSLLATHRGRGGGRSLLLNGHLDTVGVAGMDDPFGGRLDGDRLLGRGACDMKGGVAALVAAAETAAAAGTAGDVVLALVADEEHASVGTEAVLAHLTAAGPLPDACLVAEPTWLDLVVAHRGYAVVGVELRGRAGHSSQPGLGVNAVTHLGRLLAGVEARDAELAAAGQDAADSGLAGSLMSTVVAGGSSTFVLADRATAVLERRTRPGEPSTVGLAEVEELLAALRAQDPAVDASAGLVLAREAWRASPGAEPLAAELTTALGDHDRPPGRRGAPYWMESALWEAAGVPTVVCGPGGGGLHAADEWGDVGEIRVFARALTDVLNRFCG